MKYMTSRDYVKMSFFKVGEQYRIEEPEAMNVDTIYRKGDIITIGEVHGNRDVAFDTKGWTFAKEFSTMGYIVKVED